MITKDQNDRLFESMFGKEKEEHEETYLINGQEVKALGFISYSVYDMKEGGVIKIDVDVPELPALHEEVNINHADLTSDSFSGSLFNRFMVEHRKLMVVAGIAAATGVTK